MGENRGSLDEEGPEYAGRVSRVQLIARREISRANEAAGTSLELPTRCIQRQPAGRQILPVILECGAKVSQATMGGSHGQCKIGRYASPTQQILKV